LPQGSSGKSVFHEAALAPDRSILRYFFPVPCNKGNGIAAVNKFYGVFHLERLEIKLFYIRTEKVTIDKTAPVINVEFRPDESKNNYYYSGTGLRR